MKFEKCVLVGIVAGWMDGDDHEGLDEKCSEESGKCFGRDDGCVRS